MRAALAYNDAMAAYRFATAHPLVPERFTLAVDLISAWELPVVTWIPMPALDEDLELVHTREYIESVKAASIDPDTVDRYAYGLGLGDTPAFAGMHEAAALAVGGTIAALEGVLGHLAEKTFNPAGGLHHAMADHASGFCIYNDCAVAIERVTRLHPGLRVAYVDIDAHHGDGVEAAFADRSDVLTCSIHESGQYLFPGTGAARDIGTGTGRGFALNVPLPPDAGPECFEFALAEAVEPAVRAFAPDVIVAQLGGDSYALDPLTHLAQTVAGHSACVRRIVALADDVADGKLAATGGGGYEPFSAVPRMWASAMAILARVDVPDALPTAWLERANEARRAASGAVPAVMRTYDEPFEPLSENLRAEALRLTEIAVALARRTSPLLDGK